MRKKSLIITAIVLASTFLIVYGIHLMQSGYDEISEIKWGEFMIGIPAALIPTLVGCVSGPILIKYLIRR